MAVGQRSSGRVNGLPVGPRIGGQVERGGPPSFLEVIRYDHAVMTGVEGAAGVPGGLIRAELQPEQGAGLLLLVDRIVVQTDSATPTTCSFYLGAIEDLNLVEFTGSGDIDIADEYQPIFVPGTSQLIAEWEGASAGAQGVARIQYRVARLVGGLV